jgi:ribosome-binding protein aMBF1 (putative translation factor)
MTKDFLDEIVAERTARNPDFPRLVEEAAERRRRLRRLSAMRSEARLSQTAVAARMGTSQSVVARIESGEVDARLSTLERYAAAIGRRLTWDVV